MSLTEWEAGPYLPGTTGSQPHHIKPAQEPLPGAFSAPELGRSSWLIAISVHVQGWQSFTSVITHLNNHQPTNQPCYRAERQTMTIIPGPWLEILIKMELAREEALDQVTPQIGSRQSCGAQGPSQHDSLSLKLNQLHPRPA